MPAVNLSNRLNPNNVHFDRPLAAQYKRMSKHEKEALWAADRARQHQLRELTELSQMAGLSAAEMTQLTELTQVRTAVATSALLLAKLPEQALSDRRLACKSLHDDSLPETAHTQSMHAES